MRSVKMTRLGLFHWLQRITSKWTASNPTILGSAVRELADCFTYTDPGDTRTALKISANRGRPFHRGEEQAQRRYLRGNGRTRTCFYDEDIAVRKAIAVFEKLQKIIDPVTKVPLISSSAKIRFNQQIKLAGFVLNDPFSQEHMYINMAETSQARKGKAKGKALVMPRWKALRGENALEGAWRILQV